MLAALAIFLSLKGAFDTVYLALPFFTAQPNKFGASALYSKLVHFLRT